MINIDDKDKNSKKDLNENTLEGSRVQILLSDYKTNKESWCNEKKKLKLKNKILNWLLYIFLLYEYDILPLL